MRALLSGFSIAAVAYLTLVAGTQPGEERWPIRVVGELLAISAVLVWLNLGFFRKTWAPRSNLTMSAAGCLALYGFGSVTAANRRIAVEYLDYVVLLVALFLLLSWSLGRPGARARMLVVATCFALGLGAVYILVVVLHWVDWTALVGHVGTPPLRPSYESIGLGNPSTPAILAILFLSSAVAGHGLTERSRWPLFLIAGVVALATVLTGSRGTAGAAVLALLPWVARPAALRFAQRGCTRPIRLGQKHLLGAVVVGAAALVLLPGILARVTEGGGADVRVSYATASLRMFLANPITGVGAGMWGPLRGSFTDAASLDYYLPQAHNIILQTIAEFGVLGLFGITMMIAPVASLLRRALIGAPSEGRRFARAAIFNLTFVLIQELTNPFATQPAVLFALLLPVAWIDATSAPDRFRKSTRFLLSIAVLVAALSILMSERANLQNVQALRLGARPGGTASAADASAGDAFIPVYRLNAGLLFAAAGHLERAQDYFRDAATTDDFPASWLDLAATQARLRNPGAALTSLEAALRLGRQEAGLSYGSGMVALDIGNRDVAIDAFAAAIGAAPPLADERYWASPGLPEIREASINLALERARDRPLDSFDIAVEAGRVSLAKDLSSNLPEPKVRTASLVVAAWSSDRQAYNDVISAAESNPTDQWTVGWAARLSRRLADGHNAVRFYKWLDLIDPVAADTYGRDILVAFGDTDLVGIRGANATAYGPMLYRRDNRRNLFVDWLPWLCYSPEPT